jgi:hypothetical protein
MTGDQFIALLLFQLPFISLFNPQCPLMIAIIVNLIVFMILTFIAENEFIKDCKKGYCGFEDSILPMIVYNKWRI